MLNNRKITCLLSSVFIYAIAGLSTQAFAVGINEVMQEGENRADAGATAQNRLIRSPIKPKKSLTITELLPRL